MRKYKVWEQEQGELSEIDRMDRSDRPGMYRLITSFCNATEYEGWAAHTFGLDESELPTVIMFSPKEDGYWKMPKEGGSMTKFVENIFDEKLEITYTRSWFARQTMKLEKWLNSLNGWQIALFFVSVFVGLCGLMMFLDWLCSPKSDEGIKMD